MAARIMRWARSACVASVAPLLLGGCFGIADRAPVAAEAADPVVSSGPADARPPVKTVKRAGADLADATDPDARGDALPTPSRIFDFHPPGSKPDTWRQPFIIDPNDGPLAGYVRRMDAELAEQTKQVGAAEKPAPRKKVCPSTGPDGAISTTCGENEAAKAMAR